MFVPKPCVLFPIHHSHNSTFFRGQFTGIFRIFKETSLYFLSSNPIQSFQHYVCFIPQESLKQVKIVSVNNPLVFLNARKFHTDLIKIIQQDSTSSQTCEDVNKVGCTICFSHQGDCVEGHDCFTCFS